MRLLFYTDLHAKDQTPRSRTGSYRDDILAKLREIVDLAIYYNVDYLVNGADTFDHKSSWRTSHLLVTDMIKILQNFDGEKHITIVGTHDVPTGQIWKVPQQPLGVLEEAAVINIVDYGQSSALLEFDDVIFHGVHASYDLDKDPKNYEYPHDRVGDDNRPIVTLAHGMIVPPGAAFYGDFTDADKIQSSTDILLYGHPHTPDGIYKNQHGTIFVGPGSIARLGSYPYNRERVPKVILLEWAPETSHNWKFKELELSSARPGPEIFEHVIQEEADENEIQQRVNEFVETLRTARIADDTWGIEDLRSELRAMEVKPEVKKYAEEILDEVSV